jgi:hypothetical protein
MGKYTDALKRLDKLPLPGPEGGDFRTKVFEAKLATPRVTTLLKMKQTLDLLASKFGEYPTFQATNEGRQPTTKELIDTYVEVRRAMDAAAKVTSALEVVKTAVEEQLADRYENDGLDTVKTDDGITVRHQPEPYAQVEDRDKLREWYKAEGLERDLNPAWASVNALCKERLLAAMEPMPGVKIFSKSAHFVVSGLKKTD